MANNIHPVAEFREPRLLACSMDPHLPTALSPKETSPPWHLQQFRNQRINVRGWQHFPNENSSSLSSAQTCSNRARSMGTHGLSSVRSSLAAGSAFAGFPRQSMTIRGAVSTSMRSGNIRNHMNSHPLGGRRAFASPTHEPTERPRTSKNRGRTRAHMQALQASHALDCVHEQAKARYLDLVSQLPASGFPSKVHECPHLDPVPHGTAMRRRLARTLLRACPETRAAAGQGSPPHKSDTACCP